MYLCPSVYLCLYVYPCLCLYLYVFQYTYIYIYIYRGRGRGEGELVHEEERIVAGSYFISAWRRGGGRGQTMMRETLTMSNVCSIENDAIQV